MAYNTTASLDKLSCTNSVYFGKCQDRRGRVSWSKNDSNYSDVKFKVLKRDHKEDLRVVQNLTKEETDFNQFMLLTNQLAFAAENFGREESLYRVLRPTMSKDMDEQLKLAHKVIDVVDRAKRKIRVTLLRYEVEKLELSID